MKKDLNIIYSNISAMMLRAMKENWSEAVLEVELHALAMKLSGGYMQGVGNDPFSFKFSKEDKKILMDSLIQLHLHTDKDEESRWNTLNYHLYTDGKYKADFIWNQDLADNIEKVRAVC